MSENLLGILEGSKYKLVVDTGNSVVLSGLPDNKRDRDRIISLTQEWGGTVLYSGQSKIDCLYAYANKGHSINLKNNISKLNCALDVFVNKITKLDKIGDEYIGISVDRPFVFSPSGGFYGKKNVIFQYGKPQVIMVSPDANAVRISLETVLAVLDELFITGKTRSTYLNLVGNSMGNEVSHGKALSTDRVEIVTRGLNTVHGSVWNRCFKQAKCRVFFSAMNMEFMGYILKSQFPITEAYILNYPGGVVKDVWDGDTYYCIP